MSLTVSAKKGTGPIVAGFGTSLGKKLRDPQDVLIEADRLRQ